MKSAEEPPSAENALYLRRTKEIAVLSAEISSESNARICCYGDTSLKVHWKQPDDSDRRDPTSLHRAECLRKDRSWDERTADRTIHGEMDDNGDCVPKHRITDEDGDVRWGEPEQRW